MFFSHNNKVSVTVGPAQRLIGRLGGGRGILGVTSI